MPIVKLRLPLSVPYPTKKRPKARESLSLNQYKRWSLCIHKEKTIRTSVKELMELSINRYLKDHTFPKLYLHYMFHRTNEAKFDMGNFTSVLEKYFLDLLQKKKKIEGDDWGKVVWGSYSMYPTADKTKKQKYVMAYLSDTPLFIPTQELLEKINE